MAGPNPILANGRIRIPYTTDEPLTHNMDFYVDITGTGTPPNVVTADGGAHSWHDAVDAILTVLAPAFGAGTTFNVASLDKYVSGSYQAIDSYTSTVLTGSGSAGIKAEMATFNFRDALFRLMKVILLGSNIPAPNKARAGFAGSVSNAIFADFVNVTAGHSGFYVVSRSNVIVASSAARVTSFNRKSRRRLGLL